MALQSGDLNLGGVVTLDFIGPARAEDESTFRDHALDVTFVSASTGQTLVIPGYFAADGDAADSGASSGNVWRVQFNPPSAGEWTYSATLRTGDQIAATPAIDGVEVFAESGSLTIGPLGASSDRGGILRAVDGYLTDTLTGERVIKGGAGSPENFLAYYEFDGTRNLGGGGPATADGLHHYDAHLQHWRPGDPTWQGEEGKAIVGAINYLADQGVNSLYFLPLNVLGDGKDVWPWVEPTTQLRYDASKLAQWEIVFDHMDEQGVILHVVTQEQENDQLLNGGELGTERAVYYRELVARFGHHDGVLWNLGEENTNTDAQRKAFADYIEALDPYDHPIVVHTFPKDMDAVYQSLLGYPSVDGASLHIRPELVHAKTLEWIAKSDGAGRPWLVTVDEVGPAQTGVMPDGADGAAANHDLVRAEALWGNLMAGGGGAEWYFGYDYAHNDLTLEDFASRESVWHWTSLATDFFAGLPLGDMVPADDLTARSDDFVLADPGTVYALYLKNSDTATTQLDLGGETGTFEVLWFDPRNGGALQAGTVPTVTGGGVVDLGDSPSLPSADWAILVQKTSAGHPTSAPVAVDDSVTTDEDTAISKVAADGLLANDTDPDGNPLSITGLMMDGATATVGQEITLTSGALLTVNANGSYSYDPNVVYEALNTGESQQDSFEYTVSDGTASATGTVTLTIEGVTDGGNSGPVAGNDVSVTDEDTVLNQAAPGVLGNDIDVDADTLMVMEVNGRSVDVGHEIMLTSGALLTVNASGSYSYDPNGAFEALNTGDSQQDSFDYTVSDGIGSAVGTVTLTIEGLTDSINNAPTAAADVVKLNEDATSTNLASLLLSNDTDLDAEDTKSLVSVETSGSLGTVAFNAATQSLTYSADADLFDLLTKTQTATDTFSYTMADAAGAESSGTVTVTVAGIGNGAAITGNDANNTLSGTALDEKISGQGGNDVLNGLDGADQLYGGTGNDQLFGGHSIDMLSGQGGTDTLDGGPGADRLTGGNKNDIIRLVKGEAAGDVVTDFTGAGVAGGDSLSLQGYGSGATLSNTGDDWTVTYTGGFERFQLTGVTNLSTTDYAFV
jgi:VCBS repeat-containing protein